MITFYRPDGVCVTDRWMSANGHRYGLRELENLRTARGYRVVRRPYELWAEYRGLTVRVLAYHDPERFHQICRALARAQELDRRLSS
jgi:hypothetical protein